MGSLTATARGHRANTAGPGKYHVRGDPGKHRSDDPGAHRKTMCIYRATDGMSGRPGGFA